MFKDFDKILIFGDQWCDKILPNIHNNFWADVLDNWKILNGKPKNESFSDTLRTFLWYNSEISKNTLYFPDWYRKGIHMIADIIDSECKTLSLRYLNNKYNTNINILNYYTIKTKVDQYLAKHNREQK